MSSSDSFLVWWPFGQYPPLELFVDEEAMKAHLENAEPGVAETILFQSVDISNPEMHRLIMSFVNDRSAHVRNGFTLLEDLVASYGDARDQAGADAIVEARWPESIEAAIEFGFRPRQEHPNALDIARSYGLRDAIAMIESIED